MTDLARFAPAALLGVGCLLVSGARDQKKMPPRMDMAAIQMPAPGYVARDVPVPKAEQKVAGMSNYVLRAFQRDSLDPGFSVYVGYYDYQVQGKTIHSPKNCLPGGGWEAVESGTRTFALADGGPPVTVNRYFAANTERRAQAMVYYWYEGRGRVEANEYRVKWNLLRDAALHGRTEEALVRIVVPIVVPPGARGEEDPALLAARAGADSLATRMARELVPRVAAALPAPPSA